LGSKDKEKVTNKVEFTVPGKWTCHMSLVLHPALPAETRQRRHCGSFKKAMGHGTLSVKATNGIASGFKVILGEGEGSKKRQETVVNHHDFGKQACCLLPPPSLDEEHQEKAVDWDFLSATDSKGSLHIILQAL